MDWRRLARARDWPITDLAEHAGTQIDGLDLSLDMGAEAVAILRAACSDRVVLLFRGQGHLPPDRFLAFARRFGGTPDLHSQRHYCLPDHHEIFVVGNPEEQGKRVGATRVGMNWHTDHYHLPEPGLFTFLHAVTVPEVAGDTIYANGMAAYDALPPAMRAAASGKQVRHSRGRLFRMLFPEASEQDAQAEQRKIPDVVHPLVRTHPELGRQGLFLGGEWGSSIVGPDDAAAQVLFGSLLNHLIADRFCYRHAWQRGDVLMSDNRCSMHRAGEWDETSQQRRLHRIILIDDRPPH